MRHRRRKNRPRANRARSTLVLALAFVTIGRSSSRLCGDESDPLDPGIFGYSLEEGAASSVYWLRPGKADVLFRRRESSNEFNGIFWSPVFKGGVGTIDPDGSGSTEYFGGYLRPLRGPPQSGELILGTQVIDPKPGASSYEFQGEYRAACGFGFGAGMVERSLSDVDTYFGKLTYRDEILDTGWKYIAEVQAQQVDDEVSPGGYAAIYDDHVMGVAGTDGEQWRVTFGCVSPELNEWLRPSVEALYVDNSIGDVPGPKFLFVNATLNFRRGFLSHPARLGRAMGPQGLEYGNPLGFLRPTWNRRLDVWELGGLVDYRMVRLEFPGDAIQEKHELLLFPFHLDGCENALDGVFLGGMYDRSPLENSPGVQIGFTGEIGFLEVSAGFEWAVETDHLTTTIGLIDWF